MWKHASAWLEGQIDRLFSSIIPDRLFKPLAKLTVIYFGGHLAVYGVKTLVLALVGLSEP